MDKFNYLGVMISTDGGVGEEVAHRVFEGRKVWGTKAKLWKENVISRDVKRGLYINRSLWFGDVGSELREGKEECKVLEDNIMDYIRKRDTREMWKQKSLSEQANQSILTWFD